MKNNDLEQLKQKRLKWVEANRENGFDEGINRLLTELYPDNAHFIYELLQNAEDPKATAVQFKLMETSVEFAHNGKRLFTFKDVESITSIGNSTKRDDATSIGKFGVGFKAVFAYTNKPEIHSGKFHFRIHDLVIPETNNIEQFSDEKKQTRFIFPFDNPKKQPELARQEIEKGLRALGDNTLLFLSHIRKIDYTLSDGSVGSLQRIDRKNGRIEIHTQHPHGEPTISHWLHFHKDVEVTDENGKSKTCRVAIAYQLEEETVKNKKSAWKIVPVTGGGQVSIYFPAEKETSNLRFHLHAPFASTVARDSVRDCLANEQLCDHLADLIVSSLHDIKTMGLINHAFLDVLPNSNDSISEFYQPISEQIWTTLRTQPLIPTYSGEFMAGEVLYHAVDDKNDALKKLLDSADLSRLESRADERLDWCIDVSEALRKKIGIKAINNQQFIDKLLNPPFTLSHWLELKENAWMQQLYRYLEPHSHQFKQTALVRLNDGSHVQASKAYFPSDGIVNDKDFPRVCRATYESDHAKEDDKLALKFLKAIDVQEVTEKHKIELLIKKWTIKKPTDDEYLRYLQQFINYVKDSGTSIFNGKCIFWGDTKDGKTDWCAAKQLFIDSPFRDTGISSWFADEPSYYSLSKKYIDCTSLNIDELVDFAKKLGAKVKTELTFDEIWNICCNWNRFKPNDAQHLKYLPLLMQYWKQNPNTEFFKDKKIFWGDDKDGNTEMVTATQLFIDKPLEDTGLSAWYFSEISDYWCNCNNYYKQPYSNHYLLSKKYEHIDFIADLLDFVKSLGAKNRLSVEKCDAKNNRLINKPTNSREKTGTSINEDWHICALEKLAQNPSVDKSFAVWKVLSECDENKLKSRYRPNQEHNIQEQVSQLVLILRNTDWIPQQIDESGSITFVTPAKATQSHLPENFKYNDSNGWLTAIQFGKGEKDQAEALSRQAQQANWTYQSKVKTAKDNGFDSPEEMEEMAKLAQEAKAQGKSPSDLLASLSPQNAPDFSDDTSENPERRTGKIKANANDAPERRTEIRERSVSVDDDATKKAAKTYLRSRYTKDDKVLYCQICKQPMPFQLKDGSYYFEAVELIKDTTKRHEHNFIALCPTDAAKFKYANESEDTLKASIDKLIARTTEAINNSPNEDNACEIKLAGNTETLTFSPIHVLDLKSVLNNNTE